MKKRILGLLICIVMVSAMFAGCGSNAATTSDNSEKVATDTPKAAATTAPADTADTADTADSSSADTGSVYYLNFKPEQADIWVALAAQYTEETGVQVNVQTAASNTYQQILTSEVAKTEAPTLFQVNGPVGLAIWKDYCYDLAGSAVYSYLKSDDFALKGDAGEVYGIAYVIETYGIIYNKTLLADYCALNGAVISSAADINSFDKLKAVADDIQARKDELGVMGAFASTGLDSSSDWRFKTHLANIPIYYEYKDKGITATDAIEGTYLANYKNIFDLYITDSTCDPTILSSKTGSDAAAEFASGDAVFYQNGTWAYGDITADGLTDDELGMLPIFIGAKGEENQGLCTGSENFWCVNKNASPEDIQATLDFMDWVLSSDKGRDCIANEMGFVTPFSTFDEGYTSTNPLIKAADEYIAAGKTSVSWNFATIPSEQWKTNVGNALLEYAQGTGEWSGVETAFVDGWATEYKLANPAK